MATPNNQIRRRGSFAPLSAHYYLDDALAQAGEAAELLYVRALAFCAATLSDGLITDAQLHRGPGVGMRDAEKRARRLVEVGAWERTEEGWRIRSWLDWNKSRDEIMAAVEVDRERKSRGGKGRPPTPPNGDRPDDPHPSDRSPLGFRPESERSPNGSRPDSRSNSTSTSTYTSNTAAAAASDERPDRARDSGGGRGSDLVDTWADHHDGVTAAKRRDLTAAVDGLLAEGANADLIPAALDEAHQPRWRNPVKALPHAYEDVRRAQYPGPAALAATGTTGTGTSSQRVAAILAHRTGDTT